jgi:hypothetical protein
MVYETKEQKMRKRHMARNKFRWAMNRMYANRSWMFEIDEPIGENAKRNVAIIMKRKKRQGGLTLPEKLILNRNFENRTREEILKLEKAFDQLPCLVSFPPVSYAK